jgi:flagellar hook-basal body complex protein FliE
MAINKIGSESINLLNKLNVKEKNSDNSNFNEVLENALSSVNNKLNHADNLTQKKAMGMEVDLAENVLAIQEADMSFRLLLQVRNKIMSAQDEVMKMQF